MHISDNRWLGIAMRIAVVLIVVLIAFRALQSQADSPAVSKLCCFAIIPAVCVFEYVQYNRHSKKHKHGAMGKSHEHHADFDTMSVGSMQSVTTTRSEMLGHLPGLHPRAEFDASSVGSRQSAATTRSEMLGHLSGLHPHTEFDAMSAITTQSEFDRHIQKSRSHAEFDASSVGSVQSAATTRSEMLEHLSGLHPRSEFDASSVGSMQSAATTQSEMLGHLSGLYPRSEFDASSVGSVQSAATTQSEMLGHLSGLRPRAHDNQSDKGSAISANTTITAVADYVNILNKPGTVQRPERSIASSVKPQEHRQSASDSASAITTMSHMMQFLAQAQPPAEAPPTDKLQDLISKLSLQPQVYDNLDSVSVSGVIADAPSIGIAPSSVVVQEVSESRSIDNTVSPAIDTSIENVVKLLQDRFDSMSGVV